MSDRYDHEILLAYLEDELTPEQRAEFEARIADDDHLRRLVAQLVEDRTALRELPSAAPPPGLVDEAIQQLERQMLLGDPADEPVPFEQHARPDRRHRTAKVLAYAGLAAVVVLSGGLIMLTLLEGGGIIDTARRLAQIAQPMDDDAGPSVAMREDAGEPARSGSIGRDRDDAEQHDRPEQSDRLAMNGRSAAEADAAGDADVAGEPRAAAADALAADADDDALATQRDALGRANAQPDTQPDAQADAQTNGQADLPADWAQELLPGGRAVASAWEQSIRQSARQEIASSLREHSDGRSVTPGSTFDDGASGVAGTREFDRATDDDSALRRYSEAASQLSLSLRPDEVADDYRSLGDTDDVPAMLFGRAAFEPSPAIEAAGTFQAEVEAEAEAEAEPAASTQVQQVLVRSDDIDRAQSDIIRWAHSNRAVIVPEGPSAVIAALDAPAAGEPAPDDERFGYRRRTDEAERRDVDPTAQSPVPHRPTRATPMNQLRVRLEQQQVPALLAYLNRDSNQRTEPIQSDGDDAAEREPTTPPAEARQIGRLRRAPRAEAEAPSADAVPPRRPAVEPYWLAQTPTDWDQLLGVPTDRQATPWSPPRLAATALVELELWIVPDTADTSDAGDATER